MNRRCFLKLAIGAASLAALPLSGLARKADAITKGSYTVGTGGDYPSYAELARDMGALEGDVFVTFVSDTRE